MTRKKKINQWKRIGVRLRGEKEAKKPREPDYQFNSAIDRGEERGNDGRNDDDDDGSAAYLPAKKKIHPTSTPHTHTKWLPHFSGKRQKTGGGRGGL